jgi:acetylornithine deacetylase/succinyl-diaminopimelate desuccinylase-like protein
MALSDALAYARVHRRRFLGELKELVAFPTVSAQPRYAGDIRKCAAWLAGHLRRIGLEHVQIVATKGNPIVYADWLHAPGRPTVLIYGHYDVQPPDPLNEWRSPPFQPAVRGQDLYGRGACDDKGQLFTHVKALEAWLRSSRKVPVNVKCIFEGEEEIRSRNLQPFVERNKRALAADTAVMSDTQMLAPNLPAIVYSERGALSLELEVRGLEHDLHSGNFGGAVHNPLQALCEIVAQLHDAGGRIAIPGFYENVRHWSEQERAAMSRNGPSNARLLEEAHAKRAWGEPDFTLYERTTIRPALTVNGVTGGYQGPGEKGVIPARAFAKLSLRLVPDQDPQQVDELFRRYIARITPQGMTSMIRTASAARPALIDRKHPAMKAATLAYRKGFGADPVFLRSGGTIPAVSMFREALGIPTVLMGFGLPDDRIHAPNEKFHLPNFYRGIVTSIWFLAAISAGAGSTIKKHTRDSERISSYDH